jgi:hypothetical protein
MVVMCILRVYVNEKVPYLLHPGGRRSLICA